MAFTKINAAGIGTTETVTVDGLTVINNGSFGGNLTVSGVLTYEDVTNVDSVGLITARNGIVVGSGITLSKDGDIFATGISTFGNVNVGGVPPFAIATGDHRSLSLSGTTANSSGFLKLGNGVATGNADFDLARIQIFNGATEVARISGETGDSNNDTGQITFDTKENGGSLTERLIISREGHFFPSADSTYDIGANSVRFRNAYVDTYYGDGSNLTGITGTTINSNTNNYIITGTGTANELQGESELQWNGSNLFVRAGESEAASLNLIADQGDDNGDGWKIQSEQDENDLTFKSNISGSYVDKLKLKSNGQLEAQGNITVVGEISPSSHVNLASGKKLSMASDVFKIYHSTNAAVINESGDLNINQNVSNKDIKISTGSGPTECIRIKSTGQVGFNCTPDGSDATTALVQMKFDTNRHFRFSYGHDSLPSIESRQDAGAYNGMRIAVDNIRIKCGTSPSDRLIITNDGTSGHLADNYNLGFYNSQGASSSYWFMRGSNNTTVYGGGSDVYFVRTNGNVENANNSYGQTSDIKLKENVVDASSQWDDIKNLKVRKFNFKASTGFETHTQIGLIAQETELISAGLVEDVKDTSTDSEGKITETGTVTKHIKYSVLYMKSVKALQEAMTRIETLEAEVAALKG